ncbi:MAG: UDP-glucose 4-epimerase GalE [Armatimonadetes bacterium]|nr:UDP-glucose 4-epimerase GalE [Armatimonadota bacterium]
MIAVVGGAGYIGSHMVKYLRKKGEPVVVFDNLSKGHLEAVSGAELVQGDLRNPDDLNRLFSNRSIECVMHFAAYASVGESMRLPDLYYDNNVVGCCRLLEAMQRRGVKMMIFSSSAAVYGEPESIPIDESCPKSPTNPYGETKLVMERMLGWYDQAYGLRSVSLRYFNAAGADPEGELGEDHDPEEHLIPIVLQVALGKRAGMKVFGADWPTPDGSCVRDYVHIWDLAQAHYQALQRLRSGAQTSAYNLGNGKGYSVLQVIQAAEKVTDRRIAWEPAPRRPGDPATLVASSERALGELGWQPDYPDLEEIVRHAWVWHQTHPDGY